jgi:hypothetical protein
MDNPPRNNNFTVLTIFRNTLTSLHPSTNTGANKHELSLMSKHIPNKNEHDDVPSSGGLIVYQAEDGRIRLDVSLENETVWLTQEQMGILFGKTKQTISEHIRNIFDEKELDEKVVVRKFLTTTRHGALLGKTQNQIRTGPSKKHLRPPKCPPSFFLALRKTTNILSFHFFMNTKFSTTPLATPRRRTLLHLSKRRNPPNE